MNDLDRKIVHYLIVNQSPSHEEIARAIGGVEVGAVHRSTAKLAKAGLVVLTKSGRSTIPSLRLFALLDTLAAEIVAIQESLATAEAA